MRSTTGYWQLGLVSTSVSRNIDGGSLQVAMLSEVLAEGLGDLCGDLIRHSDTADDYCRDFRMTSSLHRNNARVGEG